MPHAQGSIAIAMLAGLSGAAAADHPAESPLGSRQATPVAHIYFNVATGERVATLLDGAARPADSRGSAEVWVADNTLPCAAFGQAGQTFGVIDDPVCTTCCSATSCAPIGYTFLDWGDAPFDQVVDAVSVAWTSAHPDTDMDGDGFGDGVPGFGAFWTWYDGDNGFNSSATRQPLVAIGLYDLLGHLASTPGDASTYFATVDLAGSFSSSMAFEIGDTDSDSPAPNFNPFSGVDLDSDGRADFSYGLTFTQPGTYDWDGDGQPDGTGGDWAIAGWPLATGNGTVVQNPDGSFTYEPETEPPGAIGIEDAYDVLQDLDDDGVFEYLGTYWFGGFHCSTDPAEFNPYAQFYSVLYGPSDTNPNCAADIHPPGLFGNGDGVVNVFDLMQFIQWYGAQDPNADLWPPTTQGDGIYNFFDIAVYLQLYNDCGL